MWNTVVENIERQLPELNQRAKDCDKGLGSLTLDPDIRAAALCLGCRHSLHARRGYGYEGDLADSVAAGAVYDRAISMYQRGAEGNLGLSVIAYIQKELSRF